MAVFSLKTMYQRITLNKITVAFFLFSVLQCFAQVIMESLLYSVDVDSRTLVMSVIRAAEVPRREIAWLTGNTEEFKLQLCTNIPFGMTDNFCTTAFDSRQGNASVSVPAGFRRSVDGVRMLHRSTITQAMAVEPSSVSPGQMNGVNMSMANGVTVSLDIECTRLLLYPYQIFKDFVREDAVLIAYQGYLLCLSFFAVTYESRAHLLAIFVARILATIWSAYSMRRTGQIANYVSHLITDDKSPCGVDLFPSYFQTRAAYEITILVVNAVGLLLSAFLSFRLLKIYTAQTFKSIGPPKELIQIHRFFLAFFGCMQLSVFFLVTAMSLWIDELMHGAIALISTSSSVYHALFITSTTLLLPWITMGWFAVRREMKKLMVAFFTLGLFFIASWAVMFYSLVFRWTFNSWPFFASLTVAAFVMMFGSCALGILCWMNFNKGLAQFLYVEDVLGKDNFQPGVFTNDTNNVEKASFDSMHILTLEGTKFVVATNAIHL